MSEQERSEFPDFWADLTGYLGDQDEVAAAGEEFSRAITASQRELLGEIDRTTFDEAVRSDLQVMDSFLAVFPELSLDSLIFRAVMVRGTLELMASPNNDPGRSAHIQNALTCLIERSQLVSKIASARQAGGLWEKQGLQGEILATEPLSMEENLLWAQVADTMLTGQGVDLQDAEAVNSAATCHRIAEAADDEARAARRALRTRMMMGLEVLYHEAGIPAHDDRESVAREFISAIVWETGEEGVRQQRVLEQLRERTARMGWTEAQYNRVVAELRALKRGGATDEGR